MNLSWLHSHVNSIIHCWCGHIPHLTHQSQHETNCYQKQKDVLIFFKLSVSSCQFVSIIFQFQMEQMYPKSCFFFSYFLFLHFLLIRNFQRLCAWLPEKFSWSTEITWNCRSISEKCSSIQTYRLMNNQLYKF